MPVNRICLAALLLLGACQTAASYSGAPMSLPPELARDAHVVQRDMLLDPAFLPRSEPDPEAEAREFISTLQSEAGDRLGRCANGKRKLILDSYVSAVETISPLARKGGHGEHRMHVIAQLVDPETKQVIGRYPMDVVAKTGGVVSTLISDRASMLGEAYGERLCQLAFAAGKAVEAGTSN